MFEAFEVMITSVLHDSQYPSIHTIRPPGAEGSLLLWPSQSVYIKVYMAAGSYPVTRSLVKVRFRPVLSHPILVEPDLTRQSS